MLFVLKTNLYTNRYKGETLLAQEEVANQSGARNLKMKSNLICRILVVVFYQWQILEKIQTVHNCKKFCHCKFSIHNFHVSSFITYRSCKHLDNKHTIFGRVVGGMETLSEMEKIEVDNQDKPIEDIVILKAQIFVDPYQEADEQVITTSQFSLKFYLFVYS